MSEERQRLFELGEIVPWLKGGGWRGMLRGGVERVLGLPQVWRMLDEMRVRTAEGQHPYEAFVDASGIRLDGQAVTDAIPKEGGVVVIANHPYGGADALALSALAVRGRPDMKVLANAELLGIDPVAPFMIPLYILGEERTDRRNVASLRAALDHLEAGGLLVVFPAGAVSHWQRESARVEDPPWPGHTARLVVKSGAPVLPVRFFGRNGIWYQVLGAVHPFLRTAFIPRAFLTMRGKVVRCGAGKLLEFKDLPREAEALTAALREAVEAVSEDEGN